MADGVRLVRAAEKSKAFPVAQIPLTSQVKNKLKDLNSHPKFQCRQLSDKLEFVGELELG